MKAILEFLNDLKRNNNREWFQSNRNRYEAAREKVLFMTELFIREIRKFDNDIPMMDPKECLFRIYRDIRFSPDKRPYKTHFGSFIGKGGFKSNRAGYYFHLRPGENYLGGGIYMPPAPVLKALRTAIFDQPEAYMDILNDPGFKCYFTDYEGEKLKTAPKGFPPDFPYIELLKPKSYAFGMNLTDAEVLDGEYIDKTVDIFREMHKMNRFLNEALDNYL